MAAQSKQLSPPRERRSCVRLLCLDHGWLRKQRARIDPKVFTFRFRQVYGHAAMVVTRTD
jgi:hypothetical protein